jgi:hypothetical protein
MKLPGFTAAASLHQKGRYNGITRHRHDANGVIVPQGVCDPGCLDACPTPDERPPGVSVAAWRRAIVLCQRRCCPR